MSLTKEFLDLLRARGSDTIYHRDDSTVPCPCRTPEGYRDPEWHIANPSAPVCNAAGFLTTASDITVKAFIQPIQSTRATRLQSEQMIELFAEIQKDDHLGIFPYEWNRQVLNFDDWSTSGEDYIKYRGLTFVVVNSNLIPDPSDGNPNHHWEVALRRINSEAAV